MPDIHIAAFKGFDDPMSLVDRTDLPYEERLAMLQEWQAAVAKSEPRATRGPRADFDSRNAQRDAILAAIHALEMGAVVQDDQPEAAPDHSGYGAVKPNRP